MRRRIALAIALGAFSALLVVPAARPPAARAAAYSNTYLLRERLCLLQAYVERYANQHYSFYPTPAMVRRDGQLTAPLWPLNPWTGGSMRPGSGIGDYRYTAADNRLSYRLAARYPGGTLVMRGAVPYTRKMQNDHRTREGLGLVRQFIELWARGHDDLYPTVAEVDAAAAVGEQEGIGYWPHDPWTHQPMKQSKAWGNFTYAVSTTRDSFTITAHFSRGGALTLRGATATSPWHRLRLALEDATLARDLDIIDGYVRLYATGHDGLLPAPSELTPVGAVGQSHAGWPSDPYSGDPFTIGDGVGHFTYTAGEDGVYSLSAPLAGSDAPYVVGGDVTPAATSGRNVGAETRDWRLPGR